MSTSKLIIVSVFTYGAIQLALNHYKTLKSHGITNYMAYVLDNESYQEMQKHGYNVTYVDGYKYSKGNLDFGTTEFNKLMYVRYHIIRDLLQEGHDVWSLDVDTVVLKDIRSIYDSCKGTNLDIWLQNDINMPCAGCVLYMSSADTINIVKLVLQNKDKYVNDQYCLVGILNNIPTFVSENVLSRQVSVSLFDSSQFPNGLLYFDTSINRNSYARVIQEYNNIPDKQTYFVHANWMIGNDTKIAALKSKRLWFI